MGYTTRWNGIRDFSPDDTDTKMYIAADGDWTMDEILRLAQEKWPNIEWNGLKIGAEHIHTNCLCHDIYDPSDYTNCQGQST